MSDSDSDVEVTRVAPAPPKRRRHDSDDDDSDDDDSSDSSDSHGNSSRTSEAAKQKGAQLTPQAGQRDAPGARESQSEGRKGGRRMDEAWIRLTGDDASARAAGKDAATVCSHCNATVKHNKKVSIVRRHLQNCARFLRAQRVHSSVVGTGSQVRDGTLASRFDTMRGSRGHISSSPFSSTSGSSSNRRTSGFVGPMDRLTDRILSDAQQKEFSKYIAMHYYVTATAFTRIEEENLAKACRVLNSSVKLPNRQMLSGALLDAAYEETKRRTDEMLDESEGFGCVTTDGWSNVLNEPIINYMVCRSNATIFHESVATGEQSHDAAFLAKDISRVINDLGKHIDIVGCVTDNTATNKAAWAILQREHPGMFFQGCASHGLHLLVKDIFAATMAKRGRSEADYPEGYPFKPLLDFVEECKEVVKFFGQHHTVKAKLNDMQSQLKIRRLALPATTRWGSILAMLQSIQANGVPLHAVVREEDFITSVPLARQARRETTKAFVLRPDLDALLNKCIAILTPIDRAIVQFQDDSAPVSDIYRVFVLDMRRDFDKLKSDGKIDDEEHAYLHELLATRRQFLDGRATDLAYLLDPRYVADDVRGVSGEPTLHQVEITIAGIANYHDIVAGSGGGAATQEEIQVILGEHTRFAEYCRGMILRNSIVMQGVTTGNVTVLQFWRMHGHSWPHLRVVALRVFCVTASSAASERNFSTMSHVHSKLRNSLGRDTVMKLVYVKTNYAALSKNDV
jgi:hypothetical protein